MSARLMATFRGPASLILSLCSSLAVAQDSYDSRIQIVDYQPAGTMTLETALGRHVVLQFAADENVISASIGDSAAWQVAASEERTMLFVRPLAIAATTNLIVVTNVRTYVFDLTATSNITSSTAYTIRFRYPVGPAGMAHDDEVNEDQVVGRYRVSGTDAISPVAIDDDGRFTYIEWAPDAPLPATFAIEANGSEALVNGQMRGGRYVLDRVAERLIFRLDGQVARARRVAVERLER